MEAYCSCNQTKKKCCFLNGLQYWFWNMLPLLGTSYSQILFSRRTSDFERSSWCYVTLLQNCCDCWQPQNIHISSSMTQMNEFCSMLRSMSIAFLARDFKRELHNLRGQQISQQTSTQIKFLCKVTLKVELDIKEQHVPLFASTLEQSSSSHNSKTQPEQHIFSLNVVHT